MITLPVDDDTAADIAAIGGDLIAARVPSGPIARIYDRAEVSVEQTTAAQVDSTLDFDGALIEVDASVTVQHDTTTLMLHKYPGGDLFARAEIDARIDDAR